MEQVIGQALGLPSQARAFIAEKLLESLDAGDIFEISPEWKKEIKKRCQEIDKGLVDLVPAEKVFEEAFRRIG
ncbi:MAG: addiction module protein [Victivallales bacterium]|jgi:putative addiction module component (TIGR02574 family)